MHLHIVKVKAHLTGILLWMSWFNAVADLVAESTVKQVSKVLPGYMDLVNSYFQMQRRSNVIMRYHVDVARVTLQTQKPEEPTQVHTTLNAGYFHFDSQEFWKPSLSWDMETCPDAPHAVFTQALAKWLLELRWYLTTVAGMFEDTSWLELMFFFLC